MRRPLGQAAFCHSGSAGALDDRVLARKAAGAETAPAGGVCLSNLFELG